MGGGWKKRIPLRERAGPTALKRIVGRGTERDESDIVVTHIERLSSGSSVRTPLPRANSYASLEGNPRPCAELFVWVLRGVALITPPRAFRPRNIDHARTDGPALATFTKAQRAPRAVRP